MFRHVIAVTCLAASAACYTDKPTEPAQVQVTATPTPKAADGRQTMTGVLHAILIPPADSTSGEAATVAWTLEIGPDNVLDIIDKAIGQVPSLDGAEVSVTGKMFDGMLIVEEYTILKFPPEK